MKKLKEINLTTKELKDSLKGNYIDSGSEASIYLHNTKNNNDKDQNVFMAKRLYDKNPEDIYSAATGKKLENKEKKNL